LYENASSEIVEDQSQYKKEVTRMVVGVGHGKAEAEGKM
jgi:hypothetical protein